MASIPPEVQKLVENLFDGLSKLGLTVTASAKADPTSAEIASMGVRPARADAEQALVNARLGWNATEKSYPTIRTRFRLCSLAI